MDKNKVIEQLEKYVHIPQQVFGSHDVQIELCNKLNDANIKFIHSK